MARTAELVAQFQDDHERPPTPVEKLALTQQATLDTRQAKHPPRSEAEQRATWRAQAESVLGPGELGRMLTSVLSQTRPAPVLVDEKFVTKVAQPEWVTGAVLALFAATMPIFGVAGAELPDGPDTRRAPGTGGNRFRLDDVGRHTDRCCCSRPPSRPRERHIHGTRVRSVDGCGGAGLGRRHRAKRTLAMSRKRDTPLGN
jgi:hypothetical protein